MFSKQDIQDAITINHLKTISASRNACFVTSASLSLTLLNYSSPQQGHRSDIRHDSRAIVKTRQSHHTALSSPHPRPIFVLCPHYPRPTLALSSSHPRPILVPSSPYPRPILVPPSSHPRPTIALSSSHPRPILAITSYSAPIPARL